MLAAILHLHAAGASPGSAQRAQFLRIKHAEVSLFTVFPLIEAAGFYFSIPSWIGASIEEIRYAEI